MAVGKVRGGGPGGNFKLPAPEPVAMKQRGEPWRIRTSDPLIKSQLLYQLS
jgi:hypothetical protein